MADWLDFGIPWITMDWNGLQTGMISGFRHKAWSGSSRRVITGKT